MFTRASPFPPGYNGECCECMSEDEEDGECHEGCCKKECGGGCCKKECGGGCCKKECGESCCKKECGESCCKKECKMRRRTRRKMMFLKRSKSLILTWMWWINLHSSAILASAQKTSFAICSRCSSYPFLCSMGSLTALWSRMGHWWTTCRVCGYHSVSWWKRSFN